MYNSSSITFTLVFALVLCGCEAHRVSKTPISYRQRPNPPPKTMPARLDASPISSSRQAPARHGASRHAADRGETARFEPARPVVAQSVVYRRADAKPKLSATSHHQTMDVGLGQLAAERKEEQRHSPSAIMPPANAQVDRQLPQGKNAGADKAKLKALYDSGFLTREEYLRAQKGR